jgi:hypothetical protein
MLLDAGSLKFKDSGGVVGCGFKIKNVKTT